MSQPRLIVEHRQTLIAHFLKMMVLRSRAWVGQEVWTRNKINHQVVRTLQVLDRMLCNLFERCSIALRVGVSGVNALLIASSEYLNKDSLRFDSQIGSHRFAIVTNFAHPI